MILPRMDQDPHIIQYRRARFIARLPTDRLYTPWHFWLAQAEDGLWRIGFTDFALRMLGELVEHGFAVRAGDAVQLGQTVGWVEGFKALTDLYCAVAGEFAGGNPAIERDITLIDSDPYRQGWLYAVRGRPDAKAVDAQTYTSVLDATIDRLKDMWEPDRDKKEPESCG
jgi:glycine cleavage system H protein